MILGALDVKEAGTAIDTMRDYINGLGGVAVEGFEPYDQRVTDPGYPDVECKFGAFLLKNR